MIYTSSNNLERNLRPHLNIAATHDDLPLQDNWAERWCLLPEEFKDLMDTIHNFEVRADDVFVVTFMKCGTTWMQETAWLLMNQLDFAAAKKENVLNRSIFLDFVGLLNDMSILQKLKEQKSPRLIKSHLPVNLLPKQLWQKKQKTIYVARNVKDVVVSSYHFVLGLGMWKGNINEYVLDFMNNDILYTSFWAHIVDFWKLRHESHIFFVTYEEMKRDLAGVVQKLCKFLERPELTVAELKQTVEHLSFEKMRENQHTNITGLLNDIMPTEVDPNFQFMRRGIVGSYKDELSAENQKKLIEWSREFLGKHDIKEEDIFGNI